MFKLCRSIASKRFRLIFELTDDVVINSRTLSYAVASQIKTSTKLTNNQIWLEWSATNSFHNSAVVATRKKKDDVEEYDEEKSLLYYQEFEKWEERNKKTFLETVRTYTKTVRNKAGHVDFIKAALKNMKDHGVHRDLECYKKILNVLPKGVYVAKSKFMAASMYFPRQQYAVMDLLSQMGRYGVLPDAELGIMIINIFGKHSPANKHFEQMLYWSLKWRHRSPFPLPRTLPSDPYLLAKLAIQRMTSVDPQTEVSVYQADTLKDSIDKTWIVSGQSPKQQQLLKNHSKNKPVVVEGGHFIWLGDKCIDYFLLKADGEPLPFIYPEDPSDIRNLQSKYFNPNFIEKKKKEPSVHEQDDGIVYAVCATGTSSKDSLLSWIRILETTGNSVLADLPVLFRFKEKEKLPATTSDAVVQKQ